MKWADPVNWADSVVLRSHLLCVYMKTALVLLSEISA